MLENKIKTWDGEKEPNTSILMVRQHLAADMKHMCCSPKRTSV